MIVGETCHYAFALIHITKGPPTDVSRNWACMTCRQRITFMIGDHMDTRTAMRTGRFRRVAARMSVTPPNEEAMSVRKARACIYIFRIRSALACPTGAPR